MQCLAQKNSSHLTLQLSFPTLLLPGVLHFLPLLLTPTRLNRLIDLYRMLIQTLIPLDDTSNQESPATPKRAQRSLVLRPARRLVPETRTQGKANPAYEVPKSNMPPQSLESRFPPLTLSFNHEECSGDYEATSANHLRRPVYAIRQSRRHVVEDTRQRRKARNPENSGAKELRQRSDKAQFMEVVIAQVSVRWEPDPEFPSLTARG